MIIIMADASCKYIATKFARKTFLYFLLSVWARIRKKKIRDFIML